LKRFALIMMLLLLALPLTAQDDDPVISPELDANLDALEVTVSELRELDILEPVTRLFPTREEAAEFFITSFDDAFTQDVVLESTLFYRAFDFVEPDFDIESIYTDLVVSQIGGYYNTETQEMNTLLLSGEALSAELPILERIIYVHEFTHALQDQHFALDSMLADQEDEDVEADAALASLALVEGDATLMMQFYTQQLVQENPDAAAELLASTDLNVEEIPEGTPAILEAELTMPYLSGLGFVFALYSSGGWEAVDAAYDNPPQSTEQILHPLSYVNGDVPLVVSINAAEDALGAGWALTDSSRLGEFYLRQWLLLHLRNAMASAAAQGWGGDQYALYYNADADQLALVMATQWDALQEAEEFHAALLEFAEVRAAGGDMTTVDGYTCWAGADALCIGAVMADDAAVLFAKAPSIDVAVTLLSQQ